MTDNQAARRSAADDPELAALKKAAAARPRDARAQANLGIGWQRRGQLEQALACQRRALALDPSLGELHPLMAPLLRALGRYQEAVDSYRAALVRHPDNLALLLGLADSLSRCQRPAAAATAAREACALAPNEPEAHLALAAALHATSDYEGAIGSLQSALALQPDNLAARLDLGNCLYRAGRPGEAAAVFRAVLAREPDHFDALANLGASLRESGQMDEAVAVYQQALALRPGHPAVMRDLGLACHWLGREEQALANLAAAVAASPDDPLGHRYYGFALLETGSHVQALRHYQRAFELAPELIEAHSSMLFALSHTCSDPAELTAAHRAFGARWETPLLARRKPHPNGRDPARRLKVGIVSGDLCNHAVATFIEPILAPLSQSEALTLYAYYNNPAEDETTADLKRHIRHWRQVTWLDDDALEAQIRADGIDILIDLHGHTPRHRLTLFARRPAPVQATWIGYGGTTGMESIDYFITDGFHLPEGRYDDQFTEKIVRLPLGAPFQPWPGAPAVGPLPALANGHLTFGSFHRVSKVSRPVVALWSQLLRALPDARMVVAGLHPGAERSVAAWFGAEGIAPERLEMHERLPMDQYLALHNKVDVCLCPFPYTGSTTVGHALWMGVPTLATVGPTNPSHAVVPLLAHLGLDMFIAPDPATFVALGTLLAQNLGELAALRAGMRERFLGSVVGHPRIAAAGLERALRLMWQRWCAGQPAAPLRVTLADLA